MTNIFLLGSSTRTGEYINENYMNFLKNSKLYKFSSKKNKSFFLDLNSFTIPKRINFNKECIFISLAPIWLFVPYLEFLLEKKIINKKNILAIIATSSTSVITKKYTWNKYDKNLYQKLNNSEQKLILLKNKYGINVSLIRPTLIYDDIGNNSDKNINILFKIIKRVYLLPVPSNTGLRQPIHVSQLGQVIIKISKKYIENHKCQKSIEVINIGGDEEITYQEILNRIKKSFFDSGNIQNCIFIKIPNRLFFLLCIPIMIFSPKTFEAIQRITINMSGFTMSYKISGLDKKTFPVKSNN